MEVTPINKRKRIRKTGERTTRKLCNVPNFIFSLSPIKIKTRDTIFWRNPPKMGMAKKA
jgi:hypothetical protein